MPLRGFGQNLQRPARLHRHKRGCAEEGRLGPELRGLREPIQQDLFLNLQRRALDAVGHQIVAEAKKHNNESRFDDELQNQLSRNQYFDG